MEEGKYMPEDGGLGDNDAPVRQAHAEAGHDDVGKKPPEKGNAVSPDMPGEMVRYSFWLDILAILGAFFVGFMAGLLVQVIIEKTAAASAGFAFFVSYLTTFSVTIVFAIWLLARSGQNRPILRFSLKKTNPSLVLWGLILVLVTSVVIEPLLAIFPERYLDTMNASIGRGGWAMLTTIVVAPMLEEILFRGIIQESVTRRYGGVRGVLLASAIFGLVHILIPQQAVNAFFMGIILGYIYVKTKSLVPVMLIHAVNNAIAYVVMMFFGESITFTRNIIGNDTVYWIIYFLCAAVFIVACFNVWSQLRREPGHLQKTGGAV